MEIFQTRDTNLASALITEGFQQYRKKFYELKDDGSYYWRFIDGDELRKFVQDFNFPGTQANKYYEFCHNKKRLLTITRG